MINTKHVLKVVAAWVTIVYIICFGSVALIPSVRPWFKHYALHMNISMGENIVTLTTFISGLVIWNAIGFLKAPTIDKGRKMTNVRSTAFIAIAVTFTAICCPLCFETFEKDPRRYLTLRRLRQK